jgi:long-chain acyl-CoA synthetase
VLSGYGLAETASLFTGNRPGQHRLGSVGQPLAGGQVRITDPDESGIGAIELHGASITAGYIDNPEADRAAFTPDGWFRTGDLGSLDRDGFLFIAGRSKETLVLGGGKKVNPEDLERVYGAAPEIIELALLEDKGSLVALVRPDPAKLRARGAVDLHEGVRIVLGEKAQSLPSYERLSGFALTDQPLPRTRLGKYRRFFLPNLYAAAAAGGVHRSSHQLGPEDKALLSNPTATAAWHLLQRRYPGQAVDLDINLGLDLNLDSFGWMELTLLLQDQLGIHLSETDIAGIETIRDLLHRSVEQHPEAPSETAGIAADLQRWLRPRGLFLRIVGTAIFAANRLIMRGPFGLRASGYEHLPESGPFVIAPNHVSFLDPPAIAAALPFQQLSQLYWAGDIGFLFSGRLVRCLARSLQVFPVDRNHPAAAIETAKHVLADRKIQVWFPEGWRSPDGALQPFLPGVGALLLGSESPVVPAYIGGTFEAWPRSRRLPRFRPISVTFGAPVTPAELRAAGQGASETERIADGLRARVAALANQNAGRAPGASEAVQGAG